MALIHRDAEPSLHGEISADTLCDAFFGGMDADEDGFISKDEAVKVSTVGFGEGGAAAEMRWAKMIAVRRRPSTLLV